MGRYDDAAMAHSRFRVVAIELALRVSEKEVFGVFESPDLSRDVGGGKTTTMLGNQYRCH